MMEILPKRCVPIAKKEILYMGTFGLACWLAGVIFIDRKKSEKSIATLTEVAHSLHKDNVSGEESSEEPLENRNLDVGGKRSLSLGWALSRTEREQRVCSVPMNGGQENRDEPQGTIPLQWLRIVPGGPSALISSPSCSCVS